MMELTTLPSIWSALGSSLLQFLWQGAVIGLIAALVLELLGKGRASVRYLVCCGALASCVLAFVVTFSISLVTAIPFSGAKEAIFQLPDPLFGEIGEVTPSVSWFENLLSVETIAWFWVLGVLAMTLRLAHQWRWSHRLKTCCVYQPDERWLQVFQTLRKEFGVDRSVRLLSSSLANVPMVVGWLQPVVLIPVAAFSALTPEQLRVVLAHELSHIRRHDHIVNFFQCVIETLLFFHPVIWWLSKQIRSEREFCCDEASVGAVNDPRILAEALLSLESSRVDTSHSFLSSQGGPLMQRIYKILGRDQDSHSRYSENLAFACFLSGLLVALFAIPASGDAKSVAVSPVSVEFSVGQDSDSDRRPQDDDDDDD
ncbi:MAG: M56 family metallopeptidase, partial [Planctomycetota bacterium]|nr:M56 family metallopeptidase [Planctomycetota bacterium]